MKTYGLIGYPLTHSFSKNYFSQKFSQLGIEVKYENFEIKSISELSDIVKNHKLSGLNVTIPYKQKVREYIQVLSPEAKEIGAVNTIKIEGEKLIGYNTDYIGFTKSIQPLLTKEHTSALVLGNGGATKAIIYALNKLNISSSIVARNNGNYTFKEVGENIVKQHQIIINCTPLGTYPGTEKKPPFPYKFLTSKHLLYDLVYNPSETSFLKMGMEKNCSTKNGMEMLELQAEEAWKIWNS